MYLLCVFMLAQALSGSAARVVDIAASEWQALNQTVGGRLRSGTPMALPCFTSYDNGTGTTRSKPNLAACGTIQYGKSDGLSIASYFGGYEAPQWSNCVASQKGCSVARLCLQTCYQGSVPSYYISCQGASDVQAGLKFVRTHDIPLVLKSTGHDLQGRSSAPGSFALWYVS
jgi:hypothetical protein